MALYLSLMKVSSIESCCESLSAAVGNMKVIGTLISVEARLTPVWAAVQNGATALVSRAYLAPAGGLQSLVAAFSSSASLNRLSGR